MQFLPLFPFSSFSVFNQYATNKMKWSGGWVGCTYCVHLYGEDGNEDAQKQKPVVSQTETHTELEMSHMQWRRSHRLVLLHVALAPSRTLQFSTTGSLSESLLQHVCLTWSTRGASARLARCQNFPLVVF